jgi:hypothetical protein
MLKVGVSALAAGVVAGVMLLLAPAPASAVTMPGVASAAPADAAMVEKVGSHYRSRGRERSRSYDRRRHGSRYSSRRPGFTYYYGGYYYANPWWLGPSFGFGVTVPIYPVTPVYPVMSAHAQWCSRYMTYDVRTDTYVPRIGVRVRCISPYPPPW